MKQVGLKEEKEIALSSASRPRTNATHMDREKGGDRARWGGGVPGMGKGREERGGLRVCVSKTVCGFRGKCMCIKKRVVVISSRAPSPVLHANHAQVACMLSWKSMLRGEAPRVGASEA
jgi:hypothetical protein